jgi:hypothetical protein
VPEEALLRHSFGAGAMKGVVAGGKRGAGLLGPGCIGAGVPATGPTDGRAVGPAGTTDLRCRLLAACSCLCWSGGTTCRTRERFRAASLLRYSCRRRDDGPPPRPLSGVGRGGRRNCRPELVGPLRWLLHRLRLLGGGPLSMRQEEATTRRVLDTIGRQLLKQAEARDSRDDMLQTTDGGCGLSKRQQQWVAQTSVHGRFQITAS